MVKQGGIGRDGNGSDTGKGGRKFKYIKQKEDKERIIG
jgi:hypothetical protein